MRARNRRQAEGLPSRRLGPAKRVAWARNRRPALHNGPAGFPMGCCGRGRPRPLGLSAPHNRFLQVSLSELIAYNRCPIATRWAGLPLAGSGFANFFVCTACTVCTATAGSAATRLQFPGIKRAYRRKSLP